MDLGRRGTVAIVTEGSDPLGLAPAGRLAAERTAIAICGRDAARLPCITGVAIDFDSGPSPTVV
jgi:hypothetical protein